MNTGERVASAPRQAKLSEERKMTQVDCVQRCAFNKAGVCTKDRIVLEKNDFGWHECASRKRVRT